MRHEQNIRDFIRPLMVISTVICTIIFSAFAPTSAQDYETVQQYSDVIQSKLESSRDLGLLDRAATREFYAEREYEPYWIGKAGVYPRAEQFLLVLEQAWTHGLNPAQYNTKKLEDLIDSTRARDLVSLELALTDAFTRYARDLSGMRINAKDMRLEAEHWKQQNSARDVLAVLAKDEGLANTLKAVEPQGKTYQALRRELIKMAEEDSYAYEKHLPIEPGGILKPGWSHKSIAKVRARLGVAEPANEPFRYDDTLAAAVMEFQHENGLNADGVIGSNTLELLNRTRDEKILQLMANMERLRWADQKPSERYVVVNVPSATLWAIKNDKVAMEMDVIVGSPYRRTTLFRTEIEGVRLNPDWTIPATIKRFDILPKVQADKNYLKDKGVELFKGYGKSAITIDPDSIDWHTISAEELRKIRFVQVPGDHNPLGRVRVLMPNKYNIYLHDTNHPEYFEKSMRALSSGCLRMKEPKKMADFILEDRKYQVNDILQTLDKTDLEIKDRIPVYIYYYTNWVSDTGEVVYGADIYNYDEKLVKLLHAQNGLSLPPKVIQTKVAKAESQGSVSVQ